MSPKKNERGGVLKSLDELLDEVYAAIIAIIDTPVLEHFRSNISTPGLNNSMSCDEDELGNDAIANRAEDEEEVPDDPETLFSIGQSFRAINDMNQCVKWYDLAAARHHCEAMRSLAQWYLTGQFVSMNKKR